VNGRDGENAIPLEGPIHTSAGSDLFHGAVPATSVACASCHPEGREDGRVWHFDLGDRRTQSVSGGVLGTIPLHWGGDLPDMNALIQETLVNRMLGETPSDARVASLSTWLDQLPEPQAAPEQDADAVERGRALFEGAANCSGCHAGEALTNDATVDVGTGGRFQVPSLLGVSARAPFLHDGAAQTLTDRFNPAIGGGDLHGHTSQLDEAQISDLVAYLETL
jgi:mono/diheme cytochrome c family protein